MAVVCISAAEVLCAALRVFRKSAENSVVRRAVVQNGEVGLELVEPEDRGLVPILHEVRSFPNRHSEERTITLVGVRRSITLHSRRLVRNHAVDANAEDALSWIVAEKHVRVNADLSFLQPVRSPLARKATCGFMLEGKELSAVVFAKRVGAEVKRLVEVKFDASGNLDVPDVEGVEVLVSVRVHAEHTQGAAGVLRGVHDVKVFREVKPIVFLELLVSLEHGVLGIAFAGSAASFEAFPQEDFHRLVNADAELQVNVRSFRLPAQDVGKEVLARAVHVALELSRVLNFPRWLRFQVVHSRLLFELLKLGFV